MKTTTGWLDYGTVGQEAGASEKAKKGILEGVVTLGAAALLVVVSGTIGYMAGVEKADEECRRGRR